AAPAEPAPPARASVRFVSPAGSDVVYGPTPLRVAIVPPSGTRVVGVEFLVDDKKVGAAAHSPFEIVWDAGTTLASHVLRAVASFSDGTTQEDTVTTRKIVFVEHALVQGSAIDHVELLVAVTDGKGNPVRGLSKERLVVRDGGDVVTPTSFQPVGDGGVPLSVAILVDRSGSMQFQMLEWADACVAFLSVLRPTDQLRVAAFANSMAVLQDFTHDQAALTASLTGIGPGQGSTRLFRAIFETVRDLRDLPGRKAVIVLTDGLDSEVSLPGGPGSSRSAALTDETMRMAVRAGVTIISVLPPPQNWPVIHDLSVQTGGFSLSPSKDLPGVMRALGEGLLASYVVGYDVERRGDVNRRRAIRVTATNDAGESLDVRTAVAAYASVDSATFLKDDIAFGSPSQRVRALREIARLGSPEALPAIRKALGDLEPAVRGAALASLAELGAAESIPEIAKRLQDPDPQVATAAAESLARFGARAIPQLRDAARSGRPTRPAALQALGGTGDASVMPDLLEALRTGTCEDKGAAIEGIRSMAVFQGDAWLPRDPPAASQAAGVMELLVGEVGGSCRPAAEWAAVVLGRLAHPAALPVLVETVRARPDSPRLVEALTVLASYPTRESLTAVETRLTDPATVRQAARRSAAILYAWSALKGDILTSDVSLGRLALLGGDEALAAFRELLKHPAPDGGEARWRGTIEATIRKLEGGR
ncbi:MAG TPA: VWA domain-containing protein, partial [Verrucomicrobiae bacterium]|nr:VWA domain-containing protein [Verrucomicrobiae bacterium]